MEGFVANGSANVFVFDPAILERYDIIEKHGQGEYATVFKALHLESHETVAIKRIQPEQDEGIPATAIREVALLRDLNHANVLALRDLLCTPNHLYMVFEFVEQDLRCHMRSKSMRGEVFSDNDVTRFSYQLLSGMSYCHSQRVLHRDIKPANILMKSNKHLLLADFGLARTYTVPIRTYTHEVSTLWYRSPEILLGEHRYNCAIDIWSIGCVMGELMFGPGRSLFAGESEIGTLFRIFEQLGTPTETTWPGCTNLPFFTSTFPKFRGTGLLVFKHAVPPPALKDLVLKCLDFNPSTRITGRAALEHEAFTNIEMLLDPPPEEE